LLRENLTISEEFNVFLQSFIGQKPQGHNPFIVASFPRHRRLITERRQKAIEKRNTEETGRKIVNANHAAHQARSTAAVKA
jgi:hypothetical protein